MRPSQYANTHRHGNRADDSVSAQSLNSRGCRHPYADSVNEHALHIAQVLPSLGRAWRSKTQRCNQYAGKPHFQNSFNRRRQFPAHAWIEYHSALCWQRTDRHRIGIRVARQQGGIMRHECCYIDCPEPGTIQIGVNAGDSHWIWFRHLEKWNADRDRFLADGLPRQQRQGSVPCPLKALQGGVRTFRTAGLLRPA